MNWEWKILDFFDQFKSDALDVCNWFISAALGSAGLLFFLLVIYWVIDKDKGMKIGFALLSNLVVNNFLKGIFLRKRPFEHEGRTYLRKLKDSGILSDSATGTSFPSGHSQNSAGFYSATYMQTKGKRFRLLRVGLILCICLVGMSRLYLGVHFPTDVLSGILIGCCISIVMIGLQEVLGNKKLYLYIAFTLLFLPCLFFQNFGRDFVNCYGLLLGFCIATILEEKTIDFHCSVTKGQKALRLLIGILLVGGIYLTYCIAPKAVHDHLAFTFLMHVCITFVGIYVVPLIFTHWEKRKLDIVKSSKKGKQN